MGGSKGEDLDKKAVPTTLSVVDSQKPTFLIQKNAISQAYYNISTTGKKLISMALAVNQMTGDGKYHEASFTFVDFFKTLGVEIGGTGVEQVTKCADECSRFVINFQTGEYTSFISMFSMVQIDNKHKALKMIFNPMLNDMLDNMKGQTKIEFLDYGKLKSFYALRYYDLFLSLRGFEGKMGNAEKTWYVEKTFDEIRQMFRLENQYEGRLDNFKKKVIDDPISELNEKISLFNVEYRWLKCGKRTTGVRFTCIINDEAAIEIPSDVWEAIKNASVKDKKLISANKKAFMDCVEEQTSIMHFDFKTMDEIQRPMKMQIVCAAAINSLREKNMASIAV